MADKDLVAITAATSISATDLLYAVIGGNSRKITVANFFTSPTFVTPALGTPASGVATNLTGTASGLTAGAVTTNANLTGPITSSGNATSIASQTGTGTKFVVDTSPTLITPILGVATATSLAINGATIGTDKLAVTGTASFSGAVAVQNTSIGNDIYVSRAYSINAFGDLYISRASAGTWRFGASVTDASGGWIATYAGIGDTPANSASTHFNMSAGTTAKSQIRFAGSTAPTSPIDGDFWFDGTNVKIRVSGATKTFTLT